MIVSTYRSFVAQLTAGIQFCRAFLGERMAGTQGLIADLIAEGTLASIKSHMPGHPDQAEDALAQSGSDAGLFRYRLETIANWRARVSNPWPFYEQGGTPIQMLRAVNEWGAIMFPATWNPAVVGLTEGPGSRFLVWLGSGITPWLPPSRYGSGILYGGPNVMYGISNALSEDVDTLRRLVRKWKPMRSKATLMLVLSGIACDEPGITCDAGLLVDGFSCDTGALCDGVGLFCDGTFSAAQVQV